MPQSHKQAYELVFKEGTAHCAEVMGGDNNQAPQGLLVVIMPSSLGTNLHVATGRLMSPSPNYQHLIGIKQS